MVGVRPWRQFKHGVPGLGAVFKYGDLCITVGQLCPQTANTVWIKIQEAPVEAVMDIGVEVSIPKRKRMTSWTVSQLFLQY